MQIQSFRKMYKHNRREDICTSKQEVVGSNPTHSHLWRFHDRLLESTEHKVLIKRNVAWGWEIPNSNCRCHTFSTSALSRHVHASCCSLATMAFCSEDAPVSFISHLWARLSRLAFSRACKSLCSSTWLCGKQQRAFFGTDLPSRSQYPFWHQLNIGIKIA